MQKPNLIASTHGCRSAKCSLLRNNGFRVADCDRKDDRTLRLLYLSS